MNLLDVNVLLALAWPNHEFHLVASAWFDENGGSMWATCAITQLGFIRISGQIAAFGSHARSSGEAVRGLALITAHSKHRYLDHLPSPMLCAELQKLVPPGKVTDAYLLHIAALNRATLVTFDRKLVSIAGPNANVKVLRS